MRLDDPVTIELDIGHFAFWGEFHLDSLQSQGRDSHEITENIRITTLDDDRNPGPTFSLLELGAQDAVIANALKILARCAAQCKFNEENLRGKISNEALQRVVQENSALLLEVIQVLGGEKWRNP